MKTRQAHEWMGALTSAGGRMLTVVEPEEVPVENLYDDLEFWTDNSEWPPSSRLMDQSAHPERYEHAYWLSASEKTELTTEWLKVYNASYGGINLTTVTPNGWCGVYLVRNGRYVPSHVAAGRTTNTDDWSTKYDAMRGFLWDHWTANNPSDGHNYVIAERPTVGSANFGQINLSVDRGYTYKWRVYIADGNGNATNNYLAGVPDCTNDSCAIQWEFVKGSHIKLKMYTNVHNTVDFTTFNAPTWPIAATGYYVSVDLSGAGLNALTPITPLICSASSADTNNGRVGRYAYELRGIGNDWEYLK